jgi:hypothetical protein
MGECHWFKILLYTKKKKKINVCTAPLIISATSSLVEDLSWIVVM